MTIFNPKGTTNPVQQLEGRWGYWDETWTTFVACNDKQDAEQKCKAYAEYLDKGEP